MMSGKEKIYFLIDALDDARTTTPAGQPLIVDPTNDLNRNYRDIELAQLFFKLANDEKILRVLKAPSRTKEIDIIEDLDPYDHADDGCWHIELLPTFDKYFAKIKLEPEYQDFTGYKPASQTKPTSNNLMTYEQKLDLVVKAVIEARKATRKGQSTTLYLNTTNGLDGLDREEIRNILLQLQDDEKILKIKEIPTDLESGWGADINKKDYFLIDFLDTFENWIENYLMKQKTELHNLDYINMLRIYDVVLDINEQIQLTSKTTVYFPLIPSVIRFRLLFPADTIGLRDEYCQNRLNSLTYLKEKGAITDFSQNAQGWNTTVTVSLVLSKFDDLYKTIMAEYIKRNRSDDTKAEMLKTDTVKTDPKPTYNSKKSELDIEGNKVKFKKDSFRAKLLELLLVDDKSRKKEWSWDEVIEAIEDTKDKELTKENKNKFYPACDGLTKHIASKTGVNDLLIFNKSTVQINPKYL